MTEITDAEVEAVARAMCMADGHNPDDLVRFSPMVGAEKDSWWRGYCSQARRVIAAHRAIEALRPPSRKAWVLVEPYSDGEVRVYFDKARAEQDLALVKHDRDRTFVVKEAEVVA